MFSHWLVEGHQGATDVFPFVSPFDRVHKVKYPHYMYREHCRWFFNSMRFAVSSAVRRHAVLVHHRGHGHGHAYGVPRYKYVRAVETAVRCARHFVTNLIVWSTSQSRLHAGLI